MTRIGRGPGALRRWGTAGAITAAFVSAPAVADRIPVGAPRVEPRALLARVVASEGVAYSGYAESASSIGLPDVPEIGRLVDLLGETSRLRAWYASPTAWRVDTLTRTGERGSYGTADGLWRWDSDDRRATHVLGQPRVRLPRPHDMLPPELGRRLAKLVTPRDRVTSLRARRVAGRGATGVRVLPAGETTVARLDVWADARTGLPLRVEVTAKGQDRPLLASSFLDLSLREPDPELLRFDVPADAEVDVTVGGDLAARLDRQLYVPLPPALAGRAKRATLANAAASYGDGLGIVSVVALPDHLARRLRSRLVLPFAVTVDEGTVVTSPLVNGLLVIDETNGLGYAISGAVPVETLLAFSRELVP